MITYAVKHGGRWHVLDVSPGVMIRFEDKFGQSMPDGTDGAHMWRHVAWLAHEALDPGSAFEDWLDELTDLTGDDARIEAIRRDELGELEAAAEHELDEDPTPLRPAATGGPG